MLFIFSITAAVLVLAFTKRNRLAPSHYAELELRAAKLKASAREVDNSAAAVELALKRLIPA